MELIYGTSELGCKTFIYRNFEYYRARDNISGTTSWRCSKYQRFKCKARLVTSVVRVVSDRQPDHTHEGNVATSLARRAVGEMKNNIVGLNTTPSSSRQLLLI